jgi:hypothetical protein
MRRLSLLLLLTALVLSPLALAARTAPGDGSLVVSNANGTVVVWGKGLIYGHFSRGALTVIDYKPDEATAPSVSGAKMKPLTADLSVVYSGSDVRFLFPGGKYTLRFDGAGIDISAVGKGVVLVNGAGSGDDGSFTVNGAKSQPIGVAALSATYGGKTLNAAGGKGP